MIARALRGLCAAALVAAPLPVWAQAYQCTLPGRIDPPRAVTPDGPVRRTVIARYTLAASWSPEYCRSGRGTMQCLGRNGRFGFILHGLWPEAQRGAPPQWCSTTPRPSPELLRRNLCMTPAPNLLEHEWAKHGSCMVRTPEAYFRTASILWQSLRWPDADRLSRQKDLTVGDLRRAFTLANRDWRPEQVGVVLGRNGWLREIRLCYGRDFMPQACPRSSFGPRDSTPLKIWRGL